MGILDFFENSKSPCGHPEVFLKRKKTDAGIEEFCEVPGCGWKVWKPKKKTKKIKKS